MKIVLDTNVVASGVFWSGPPATILQYFFDDEITLILTEEIFSEYSRVIEILSAQYSAKTDDLLEIIKIKGHWVIPTTLPHPICQDKDDDKFIAGALSAETQLIVSGDKLLRQCSGYHNIEIITPKKFIDVYL